MHAAPSRILSTRAALALPNLLRSGHQAVVTRVGVIQQRVESDLMWLRLVAGVSPG